MITILDIDDEYGLLDSIEFDPDSIQGPGWFPLWPSQSDLIYIRPDWPPIGSPDFADQLRAWHATHNAPAAIAIDPDTVTDAGDPCETCGQPSCDGTRCP